MINDKLLISISLVGSLFLTGCDDLDLLNVDTPQQIETTENQNDNTDEATQQEPTTQTTEDTTQDEPTTQTDTDTHDENPPAIIKPKPRPEPTDMDDEPVVNTGDNNDDKPTVDNNNDDNNDDKPVVDNDDNNDDKPVVDDANTDDEITQGDGSSIIINKDYQVAKIKNSGSSVVEIKGNPKDLYLVVTNPDSKRSTISIKHSNPVERKLVERTEKVITKNDNIKPVPEYISQYNNMVIKPDNTISKNEKIVTTKSNARAGDTHKFYLSEDTRKTTNATLKKVVSNIETKNGNRTLNIWVSNDSFDSGDGCMKKTCVKQNMVDALAKEFLRAGRNNDIYDWVTNIYGPAWGSEAKNKYSNLIGDTDTIDILLTDIEGDNSPNGGVIGFFWSKDNYEQSSVSGSNGRLIFYIDSVMFANGDGRWDVNDYWPKQMISTLGHEFQHMIHFYQKTILRADDGQTDSWLNEMLSETTEDVLAVNVNYTGPRGVSSQDGSAGEAGITMGRYPAFNNDNDISLTEWRGSLTNYGHVNAFGTYLVRAYGVGVLHDIQHSKYLHADAVEHATNQPFSKLLRDWGIAVMLSDIENPKNLPTYNTGDFTNGLYDNVEYPLGSINFFNYSPKPYIHNSDGRLSSHSNYYYKVGSNLSGKITIDIDTNNPDVEVTLIAK
jgi:hypothetical protein